MRICKRGHDYPEGLRYCKQCKKDKYAEKYGENRFVFLDNQRRWRRRNRGIKHDQYLRWKARYPLKGVYNSMVIRCTNPNDRNYGNYGGRGITVCDRWLGDDGYAHFESDIGKRPTLKHTLERRNNDQGYDPNNCYWATKVAQGANRRATVNVTVNGRTQCIAAWAREIGISATAFSSRVKNGDTGERLLRLNHAYPSNVSKIRRLEMALVKLHDVLGDAGYEGRDEVVELLGDLGLIPMVRD